MEENHGVLRFSLRLVKPYWKQLLLVGVALLVQTAARLAAPWPLKIVLDSVLGSRVLPKALASLLPAGADRLTILTAAVLATLVFALLEAASSYLNAVSTATLGQWVAHDLRQRVYAHLQRLSMSYYDRQQVGPLISTITDDIKAVQDFASSSLLTIVVDVLTILGILGVMF